VAKRNLLLVDADPRSLRVLEVSLRKAGYSVATCGDVDGALELIGLSEPDMIIADTRLTGKDGFALARELRSRPATAQLPFLFLSSDPSVEAKVKSLEIGIEDYLTKPVYMREILTRVNLIMERNEREGLGRAAKTRFSGSLEDMGLVDLLQTIDLSRKSGVLKLSYAQRRGSISFMEGRVIDAELGDLCGEAAIYRFLLWSEGAFELEFREVRGEDKLGISTQALLMEGVRRLDEWGRLQEQLPGLHSMLEVNHAELALRLGEIPDELNAVLRSFDGHRDLIQVIEASGGDDLTTLTQISKLFFDGFLMVRHRTDPAEARVGSASDPFIGYVPADSTPPISAHSALMHDISSRAPFRLSSRALAEFASGAPSELSSRAPAELASRAAGELSSRASAEPSGFAAVDIASRAAAEPSNRAAAEPSSLAPAEFATRATPEPSNRAPAEQSVERAYDQAETPRPAAPLSRVGSGEPPTVAAGRVPLAMLQLKRVSAINDSALRSHAVSKEIGGREDMRGDDRPESSRPPQAFEGEDDMAKRGKRKERVEERAGGTVIPLHGGGRGDSSPAAEPSPAQVSLVQPTQALRDEPRAADPLSAEDDHPEVHDFFAGPERTSQPLGDHWADLESAEHEPDGIHVHRRSGMVWTGAIAAVGLLVIGAFLVYHKVLMPTPEDLGSAPISLPTPEMLQGTARPTLEPEPPPPAPVQQQQPAPRVEPTVPAVEPRTPTAGETAPPDSQPTAEPRPSPPGSASTPDVEQGDVAAPLQQVAPQAAQPSSPAAQAAFEAQLASARKMGFGRGAEQAYLKALELRPNSAEALGGLALLYLNQSKNRLAKERAEQTLALDPTSDQGWIVLGAAEDALGHRREAREAYAKCAALPSGKYVGECKRMVR
jgi:DNA-binding response OmpR family regulator